MAELLGPYHPEGAREHLDRRRVSRWASGIVEVDEWVIAVLPYLLNREAGHREAEAASMRRVAAVIDEENTDG